MSDKKHTETNPGVGCDVTNCKYNTIDCRCNASKISVQTRKPARRARPTARPFAREALPAIEARTPLRFKA